MYKVGISFNVVVLVLAVKEASPQRIPRIHSLYHTKTSQIYKILLSWCSLSSLATSVWCQNTICCCRLALEASLVIAEYVCGCGEPFIVAKRRFVIVELSFTLLHKHN